MAKLNLDSFNAILMQALKDQGPKGQLDLLMHELQMAYGVKIEYMEFRSSITFSMYSIFTP